MILVERLIRNGECSVDMAASEITSVGTMAVKLTSLLSSKLCENTISPYSGHTMYPKMLKKFNTSLL